MSKEEKAKKEYCSACSPKGDCPYIISHIEHKCIDLDIFTYGYEQAVEKACEWLENNLVQCWIEDFLYVQFKHHEHQEKENVLADFRKAMEE